MEANLESNNDFASSDSTKHVGHMSIRRWSNITASEMVPFCRIKPGRYCQVS